jgi:hypothetical protein
LRSGRDLGCRALRNAFEFPMLAFVPSDTQSCYSSHQNLPFGVGLPHPLKLASQLLHASFYRIRKNPFPTTHQNFRQPYRSEQRRRAPKGSSMKHSSPTMLCRKKPRDQSEGLSVSVVGCQARHETISSSIHHTGCERPMASSTSTVDTKTDGSQGGSRRQQL